MTDLLGDLFHINSSGAHRYWAFKSMDMWHDAKQVIGLPDTMKYIYLDLESESKSNNVIGFVELEDEKNCPWLKGHVLFQAIWTVTSEDKKPKQPNMLDALIANRRNRLPRRHNVRGPVNFGAFQKTIGDVEWRTFLLESPKYQAKVEAGIKPPIPTPRVSKPASYGPAVVPATAWAQIEGTSALQPVLPQLRVDSKWTTPLPARPLPPPPPTPPPTPRIESPKINKVTLSTDQGDIQIMIMDGCKPAVFIPTHVKVTAEHILTTLKILLQ